MEVSRKIGFSRYLFSAFSTGKIVFVALAVIMLLAEIGYSIGQSYNLPLLSLLALVLFSVLLAACAISLTVFGVFYAFTFVAVYVSGLGDLLAFPILGFYLICGAWIVSSKITQALVCLAGTEIVLIVVSPVPVSQLISSIFGSAATLTLSFLFRYWIHKNEQMAYTAARARQQARQASLAVRSELARQLHDTTAKDLARVSILAQQLQAKGKATPEELGDLARIASTAARGIRPMMLNLNATVDRTDVAKAVEAVTKMLSTREICLSSSVPEGLNNKLSRQQALVASTVVRESATNVLKYAPEGSQASLDIDTEGSEITISLSNEIGEKPASDITGGFGLVNLERQLDEVKGELSYGKTGSRWILYASIPLTNGDQDE